MEKVRQDSKKKSGVEWLVFIMVLAVLIVLFLEGPPELSTPLKTLFQ